MNNLLSVRGLHKSFFEGGAEIHVLRGLNLDLAEGERLAVVGESGVGKSTLLHVLGTLDRPTSGKIFYAGRELPLNDETALCQFRNRQIGFVFQFHHLLPEFTALENVMIPQMINGISEKNAIGKAKELLNETGLIERSNHKPAELSGGEQQRVAVARALANDPALILADEPTGNLDSLNSIILQELFTKLKDKLNKTFVIVTHNQELMTLADNLFEMKDGKIYKK